MTHRFIPLEFLSGEWKFNKLPQMIQTKPALAGLSGRGESLIAERPLLNKTIFLWSTMSF